MTRLTTFFFFLSVVVSTLLVPASSFSQTDVDQTEIKGAFYEVLDSAWAGLMTAYPEWATEVGYPSDNTRWTSWSDRAMQRRRDDANEFLARLRFENFQDLLDDDSKLDYYVVKRWVSDEFEGWHFSDELLLISQQSGWHIDAVSVIAKQPHETVRDFKYIIARLAALPRLIDQTTTLLKRGIERGIVQPKVIMRDVPNQIKSLVPDNPFQSPLLSSFLQRPSAISESDWKSITDSAIAVYKNILTPVIIGFETFISKTYIPKCRESIGLSALQNGAAWYKWKIRHHTTTNIDPERIFQLGMSEVTRIHSEMEAVRKRSGFKGDLAAYFEYLRTNDIFFYTDSASLVDGYKKIAAMSNAALPNLFGHLPKTKFEIRPIPLYAAPSAPTAYYEPGSSAANRNGVFEVNTYDLHSRPKWEMQPLSLHESVPGHHLQISIADELTGVHPMRKHLDNTAFVEGWALYAESLGEDLGFYKTPEDKMGQLSYEMWRAIRLVVDVGIHSKNWTRQQAIDFFTVNVGKASHDIESEVDRYIADPGQALAYKIGELKIKELRQLGEKEIGPSFNIQAFHDYLLSLGSLPLDLLERQMKRWVEFQKGK